MSLNFHLVTEYSDWDDKSFEQIAHSVAIVTNESIDLPENAKVAVLLCDDAKIKSLNKKFRGNPYPTNILSWPNKNLVADMPGQKPKLASDPDLGNIAIAYQLCFAEADSAHIALNDYLAHLLVHGTLHLLGYDHIEDTDAVIMETIEIDILAKLGISDPYTVGGQRR